MKNYMRSICSTCTYVAYCSLTNDKNSIVSCSEYVHVLDVTNEPTLIISNEMASKEFKRELVLN
ncbi:hypothetical protein QSV08_09630 [Maribacter sp. BPC-D8]|uniref:hypothetical protein n=1 Tax=Maribacter sp. BPC-D8 TaxID=3053613 RepID=UPI002B477669|nr:hypothetical protein [Maribacter sp. BPC-D8]WRI31495.1 hypothetical protein QSV08_09630 [Maribacter sp. BPC-D8]